MSVRYSPNGLQRMKAYVADVKERVQKGWIAGEEGQTLIAAQMQREHDGSEPTRVRCPDCQTVHAFVGIGQQFTCSCSPAKIRSVWDNRLT